MQELRLGVIEGRMNRIRSGKWQSRASILQFAWR
jgi:hypothetical protein